MGTANKHKYFDHYRNELVQCYLRTGFTLFCFASLFIYQQVYHVELWSSARFMGLFLIWILAYYLFIRAFPRFFAKQRILFVMVVDILATAWCMYISAELSALVASTFIWYILGYGMRFGYKYALTGGLLSVCSFLTLAISSDYWRANPIVVLGWVLAFVAIPAYSFALVKRLHISLHELNRSLDQTEQLARYDSLTQLYNRHYFSQLTERMQRSYSQLAILLVDLDGFKQINDNYGHAVGDQVLVEVATRLKSFCCENCVVGRLGGDEFMVAVGDFEERDTVVAFAENLLAVIGDVGERFMGLSASIGISFYPDDSADLSQVKRNADIAMYQVKRSGKNCVYIYSERLPQALAGMA